MVDSVGCTRSPYLCGQEKPRECDDLIYNIKEMDSMSLRKGIWA